MPTQDSGFASSAQGEDRAPVPPDHVPPISKHHILEPIARGGMSTVHRATQDSLQREVAVKIVEPSEHYDESLDRFAREVRVLALLDHPNIVPIYDYGTDPDGRRAYTMKLVRGRTLEEILASIREGREKSTLQRLLRIFRKVCDAIAFAHSRGIIHRDLKPANIMVGAFGEVLVMDWGLAADLSEVDAERRSLPFGTLGAETPAERPPPEDSGLTLYGEVLGTLEYMPPEQAFGTTRVDDRADIYALGGILYAILTLRAPISRSSYRETLEDVRQGRIDPFGPEASLPPEHSDLWRVPLALLAVVRKAMAPNRDDRFPTVGALAADVDSYLAGFATSAEKITFAGQLRLLIKRNAALSAAALVLIAVTIGFVISLIGSEQRANQNEQTARNNEAASRAAEKLAKQNEDSARIALARGRILQAESAYAANDTRQMREALDSVPPSLRDAHWQYLHEHADERQAHLNWEGDGFLVGSIPHPTKPGVFTVATNGKTHRVVEFDAKTGEALKSFSFGDGWVRALAYSPDQKQIAVGRIMSAGISIHDAETGAQLRRWDTDWVGVLQYLPPGTLPSHPECLLQSGNTGAKLWDAATGKLLWQSPHGWFHFLLPGGDRFVSVSEDYIRIHSTDSGAIIRSHPVERAIPQTASLSPDGEILVVAREDGQIEGYRIADGSSAFQSSAGEDGDIRRTAFTPDGQRIVTVAALEETGQSIRMLDATTGRLLRRLRGGAGGVESLSIHPLSNDLLITCENSATWQLPTHRPPTWTIRPGLLGGFLGGNDHLFAIDHSGALAAVSVTEGGAIWKSSRGFARTLAVDFTGGVGVAQASRGSPDSVDFVVFRAREGSIREIATLRSAMDARALAVNCDGTRVAIGEAWGDVTVYHSEARALYPELDRTTLAYTLGLAWHGKDPAKLIGIFSRHARRGHPKSEEWLISWDTSTGRRSAEMRKPSSLNCLATEPRGSRLAEAGDDKFIRIRDADTFAVLLEFRAHDNPIHAIAWNPAYPILATSATDRAIRLWNAESGRLIEELHIGSREASALRFSPDGRRLAASSPGAPTLVWDLPNLDARLASSQNPVPR